AWVVVAVVGSAENPAWLGTPLPPPLSDPRAPIMKYDDVFGALPAHFATRSGGFDELLSGAALKRDHRRIVDFSLESLAAGDTLWGRRAATPSFMHTIEGAVGELKAAGLADANVETFAVTTPMWVPRSWRLQVVGDEAFGAGSKTVTLQSAFPQPSGAGPADGITAPVVYVGHGSDADLAGPGGGGKDGGLRGRPATARVRRAQPGGAGERAADRAGG